jgi:hypothetical protein
MSTNVGDDARSVIRDDQYIEVFWNHSRINNQFAAFSLYNLCANSLPKRAIWCNFELARMTLRAMHNVT